MADVTVKYMGAVIAEMTAESTKTLETMGKYCEGNIEVSYKPPVVDAEVNFKKYELTLTKSSGWVLLTELDDETLAHINDANFTVLFSIKDGYSYEWYSGCSYVCSNTPFGMNGEYPIYGYSNRQQSETVATVRGILYPANNTGTSESLGGEGIFRVDGSKYYIKPGDGFIKGGTYQLIFTW